MLMAAVIIFYVMNCKENLRYESNVEYFIFVINFIFPQFILSCKNIAFLTKIFLNSTIFSSISFPRFRVVLQLVLALEYFFPFMDLKISWFAHKKPSSSSLFHFLGSKSIPDPFLLADSSFSIEILLDSAFLFDFIFGEGGKKS